MTPPLAPNDGPLDSETTEGIPAEGGGWWTPYVETTWGYFRFVVRGVEQPDGVILFWHDAEGGHSQPVVTDLPGDKTALAEACSDALRDAAEKVEGLYLGASDEYEDGYNEAIKAVLTILRGTPEPTEAPR